MGAEKPQNDFQENIQSVPQQVQELATATDLGVESCIPLEEPPIVQTADQMEQEVPGVQGAGDVAEIARETPPEEHVAVAAEITEPVQTDALAKLAEAVAKQEEIEKDILTELSGGQYRLEEPLVVVDPYGFAPLTALVAFHTQEPVQVAVHIAGETPLAAVQHTLDAFDTEHLIPIYGLYAGRSNEVTITAQNRAGETTEQIVQIETDPLPESIRKDIIQTYLPQPEAYQAGFTHVVARHDAIPYKVFDANGDYRWYVTNNAGALVFPDYQQGTFFVATNITDFYGEVLLVEYTFLGRINRAFYLPYGLHHDICRTPEGNLLITGSKVWRMEDFIYEVDGKTGEVLRTLDLKEILQRTMWTKPLSEAIEPGTVIRDWFHLNSVIWDDGSIIISGRHASTVARISWPAGELEWMMAQPEGWMSKYLPFLLTPVKRTDAGLVKDEAYVWNSQQHAPRMLPDLDHDSETIDILYFDNGNARNFYHRELQHQIQTGAIPAPERYSRIVHCRIHTSEKTVETIWEYGEERGEALFADALGFSQLLKNGNYLGTFSVRNQDHKYAVLPEVAPDKSIVWEAYCTTADEEGSAFRAYRAERQPLYFPIDQKIALGEPVLNLVPRDVLP